MTAVAPPTRLSPSKVTQFTNCALAFRFSAIDKLPDPSGPAALAGTLTHSVLEALYALPAEARTLRTAFDLQARLHDEMADTVDDYRALNWDEAAVTEFLGSVNGFLTNYFELEDPTTIEPIGIELRLEVPVGGVNLIGIIDRLDLVDGKLEVVDLKTGRAPSERYTAQKLVGVHFYALLCEELFGQRPAAVKLLHLKEPTVITVNPSEQSTRALRSKVAAIWSAIERACERDDFRPKPGPLCNWCSYKTYCPVYGGDPDTARRSDA